jgi:hypothetical protein
VEVVLATLAASVAVFSNSSRGALAELCAAGAGFQTVLLGVQLASLRSACTDGRRPASFPI